MVKHIIGGLREPSFSHLVVSQESERGPWYPDFACLATVYEAPPAKRTMVGFARSLHAVLRKERPDVVMAYLFGNHALVCWIAKLTGVPRVYARAANQPVDFAGSRWQPLLLAQLARPVCTAEIAPSKSVAAVLADELLLPRQRIRLIENGCDIDSIAERAAVARRDRTPDGITRILMAGSFGRRFKDQATLVEAAHLLIRRGHNINLLLAGDGTRRPHVQSLIDSHGSGDKVKLLGARNDVPELMGECDLLVHSTRAGEGMPNVLLEAMAAGIPVIATDIPQCSEVLEDGRCGLLTPPEDPERMADTIETAMADNALREGLVEAAAKRVRERYDIRNTLEKYTQLLLSGT